MSNTELFCRKSENLAKRELLITIMEDMRLIGNINLHSKDMGTKVNSQKKRTKRNPE